MASRKKKTLTLTQALGRLLDKTLLPDLRARAEEPAIAAALRQEHARELKAERTADNFLAFQERTLEQVGAAWVLSCVFVRTLEDRGLLGKRRIAGDEAQDSEQLFFELAPSLTARDYLLAVFTEVGSLPGAEDVLGPRHNPVYRLSPSNDGARALLDFFRERNERGELVWTFASDSTRVLGDLYQDLSEHVRKRYALLQTPEFVESFILDQTLTPAMAEFGWQEVRVIDPTCGSGHFLLGAFERLLDERLRKAPGVDVRTHALAALDQVYGVDVNPYAVAIARFRLTLAYLARAGFTLLAQAPKLKLNLVVADSLLHGAKGTSLRLTDQEEARGQEAAFGLELFALDDPAEAGRVFGQRYHAVVGNPPYITCKDSKLRDKYREAYASAAGKYALSAPFTERFFQLAVDSGYVGMINANSFMKREFGKKLIEDVLPNEDLTRVIDTAGAYIPGHGTPTVLLFGRHRKPAAEHVPAVLGKRGEPSTPDEPEHGIVWRSIADHFEEIGFENDYVSVAEVPRTTLNQHPWSLGGGGAAELKKLLEERAEKTLGNVAEELGFASFTGLDEAFILPASAAATLQLEQQVTRPMVVGEDVRDWSIVPSEIAIVPYDRETHEPLPLDPSTSWARFLWRYRTVANNVTSFGGRTRAEEGQSWWHWYRWQAARYSAAYRITFAEVATHNHFVLDRGGKVFKQTAPIIKLPETATEDDHLALLAYLNSSTACFWMKQVCHDKGNRGEGGGFTSEAWERFFQFSGTALGNMPVPQMDAALVAFGREFTQLGTERQTLIARLGSAQSGESDQAELQRVEAEFRALQERLDWHVYGVFGLVESADVPAITDELSSGARASDVRFARSVVQDESIGRRYFDLARVGSPEDLAADSSYDEMIELIESTPALSLIETPEYKRTYREGFRPPDLAEGERHRLLEASETQVRKFDHPISTRTIASVMGQDAVQLLTACVREAVPFLAVHRFNDKGLAKHAEWQRVWQLQRREDAGEKVGEIPVPPKYGSKDYQSATYWALRGKLDVPKERFISYPGCQKDGDPSPLIGWAGWNHLQRAQALIALYQERKLEDGWDTTRLMPMLVGLHELMFWLELWHSAPEGGSQNPAREIGQYLAAELHAHRLTEADLTAWRPEPKRARKPSKRRGRAAREEAEPEEQPS